MGWIVLLLLFYNGGVSIKYPTKVDMPLNKEAESEKKNSWETSTQE